MSGPQNAAQKRHFIRNAQGSRCAICGEHMGKERGTLDHVIPRSKGGKHTGNLVVAHRRCNEQRGSTMPTGCLIIQLAAVNAKLGWNMPMTPPHLIDQDNADTAHARDVVHYYRVTRAPVQPESAGLVRGLIHAIPMGAVLYAGFYAAGLGLWALIGG